MGIKRKGLHPSVRSRIQGLPRREWHVCKETAANAGYLYDNLERGQLYHTIEDAVDQAAAFEDVIVWPGQYTPTKTLTMDNQNMRLLAAYTGPYCAHSGTEIWQLSTATHSSLTGVDVDVITLNGANDCEIAGFRIIPYDADATKGGISVGETTECKGTWIHDNILYCLESQQNPSVILGSSGIEAQYSLVENNYFYCGGSPSNALGQLQWVHATRSCVRDNTFMINQNSALIGCVHVVHTAYVRGQIFDNRMWFMEEAGSESVTNAIFFGGTVVGGDLQIDGNSAIGFATPYASSLIEEVSWGVNYNDGAAVASSG